MNLNPARFLIFTLLLVNIAAAQTSRPTPQPSAHAGTGSQPAAVGRWHVFEGPDKDFTLDFPAEPKRVEDVQGPVTVLRRYALTYGGHYFEVSVQGLGGDPDSREANEFGPRYEHGLAQLLAEDGIKIVQTRRLSKSSYEMEVLTPTLTRSGYLHGLRRGVIRRGRQYHFGCDSIIAGRGTDSRLCRRFLDSFRLTRRPR